MTLYFEDIAVGHVFPPLVKGPMSSGAHHALVGGDGELASHPLRLALRNSA